MRGSKAPLKCGLVSRLLRMPLGLALLAIAACNGSAVVTMTATPSSDTFLVYRVGLTSVQLQSSDGKGSLTLLPAAATVDFVNLLDLSEVLGAVPVAKGTYTSALITLDYSAAQIVYDDGSPDGVTLSPVNSSGQAVGRVTITVTLDPSAPFRSAARQAGRLALDFNLAASNLVDLSAKTVTITPLVAGSTLPIDSKQARIRGPLLGQNSASLAIGVVPFAGTVAGLGRLSIEPSTTTNYAINGFVSTGSAGQAQLAALPANSLAVVYGTLASSDTVASVTSTTSASSSPTPVSTNPTPTTTTTSTSRVSFTASQVLVDSSAQLDRVSGIVLARSGNTLGLEDATLTQTDGTNTFIPGTTLVTVGTNTAVTFFGQSAATLISPQQISVGSSIDAFGIVSATSSGGIVLDASAGRVRLDLTTASGQVTAQAVGILTLNLASLGGRAVDAFDFLGSGAALGQYGVTTGSLDLGNSVVSAPVVVTGFPSAFGSAFPNFAAVTLLDPTTIQAELVVDWPGGTAAPFITFDSSAIDLDVGNSSIGLRHQIQIGSQIIDVVGLPSDPLITPSTGSTTIYSIGHAASSSVENFNTYQAFITQLQTELSGALATGMTAVGQYNVSTFAFSAASITLFLNN
jgi:hypothetical protein